MNSWLVLDRALMITSNSNRNWLKLIPVRASNPSGLVLAPVWLKEQWETTWIQESDQAGLQKPRHPSASHLMATASFYTPAHPIQLLWASNPSKLQWIHDFTMISLMTNLTDLWAQGLPPKRSNCFSLSKFQKSDRLVSYFHTQSTGCWLVYTCSTPESDVHPGPARGSWGREDQASTCCSFWVGKCPATQ